MSAGGEQLTWYASVEDVRSGPTLLPDGYRMRPLDRADEEALAQLYFDAYSPDGVDSPEAAAHELAITFAGEYGVVDPACSPVVCCGVEIVASTMVVSEAPWDDTPPLPFIIEVMTAPTHRRKGLAAAGLRWAAQRLAERGEARVGLRVMSGNRPAVELYRALGFS